MQLTVSIAQMEVAQADPEKNLAKAKILASEASRRGSQLLCFPEMWTTGFNWEWIKRHAAEHEQIVAQVGELARQNNIWISGSMLSLNGDGKPANTLIVFNPQGEKAGVYRKTHLFSLFDEHLHVAPGECLTTLDAPWGRTGLSICYDLRFPELFRSYAIRGVEVQLLAAAFPNPRLEHWRTLLRARAIENQMYVIAANQVGRETFENGEVTNYFGASAVIDPWGKLMVEAGETDEILLTVTLDTQLVERVRGKMNVLADRRPDIYETHLRQG